MDKEMIVTALRCAINYTDCEGCSYHTGITCDPLKLTLDAADLIEEQAAEIERLTAAYDAAQRALRLSIETHSVDTMQTERLERYYIKRAYRLLGAGEGGE